MKYTNIKNHEIKVFFENIKKNLVFYNKNENIITGFNSTINDKNINNYSNDQFSHLKLHDNSRIFLKGKTEIDISSFKEISKLPFKKDLNIDLTVIPFNQEKNFHSGWYNFIENNEKIVSFSGTLFFSFNKLSELLNYFTSPINMTLLLTKLDKRKVKVDSFPYSKIPKTYYEDKYNFYIDKN